MAKEVIYVLKLVDDHWYVGRTRNLNKRYQDHLAGAGSAWTKKFPPLKIESTHESTSRFDEDRIVKECMAKYGIEQVRGGTYSTVQLTPETIDHLRREIRNANDLCLRCGRAGHFVSSCYAATDVDGHKLARTAHCTRCGRDGHVMTSCYADTDLDGNKLARPRYDHVEEPMACQNLGCTIS